ncbi:MAG TPA: glycosyltransferase family 29 protein [Verrucomicrobiae bacterium]
MTGFAAYTTMSQKIDAASQTGLSTRALHVPTWLSGTDLSALKHAEDILQRIRGRIAIVGNATPKRAYGKLIDSYDCIIRFNNFRLEGFADLVGTRTDLRCTTGWHDIEHREGLIEFSPFTADSREASNLATFSAANHRPVLAARTDIHPLVTETPNPSCGLALVQLLNSLGIEADLFGFDGFQTSHYWNAGQKVETSHTLREMDIVLSRPNIILIGDTYPYAELYQFCHAEHTDYDENVGAELFRRLNKKVTGKKILEFGAGNGGLSAQLEKWGNEVTAFEVATNAFDKIQCSHKVNDSALGLPYVTEKHDLFVSADVLEHLTENDIRLVLREAARTCSEIFLAVSTRPSGLLGPKGENLHLTVRPNEWWVQQVGRWFEVKAYPGYGQGQLVLEGALHRRSALAYNLSSIPNASETVKSLALPETYKSRPVPEYFEDSVTQDTGIIWQPEVYPYAAWLAKELGCHRIIDVGCGRAGKLVKMSAEFAITGLDFGSNLEFCRTNYPQGQWREIDFDQASDWGLPLADLNDAVMICADVIEHLRDPRPLLANFRRCLAHSPALIISTPERELTRGVRHAGPPDNPAHTREWSLEELVKLLQAEGFSVDYAGLTPSNDREPEHKTILCVISLAENNTAARWSTKHSENAFAPFAYRIALRERNGDTFAANPVLPAPATPGELLAQGRIALQKQDLVTAKTSLEQAVQFGINDKDIWTALAELRQRAGERQPAIEAWHEALSLGCNAKEAFSALGYLHTELGHFDAAITAYLSALDEELTNVPLRIRLGFVLLQAGRPMDALNVFQQLLTEEHEEVEVFWGMAKCCAALADFATAKTACECVLAVQPDHTEAERLWNRLSGNSSQAKQRESGWSFCLITNGKRPQKLQAEIDSIRALNIPAYEILIAGEAPENLDAGAKFIPAVDAARNGRLGEMRNRLTEQARFDHLVVADDDLLFHGDFYTGLQQYGDAWDVLCVRFLNPDGTRFWDWATHGGIRGHKLLAYTETDEHVYVTGGLCVLKASIADRVQWDDGRGFYQGEDVDFSARLKAAGITPKFNELSTVTHDDDRYTQRENVVVRDSLEVKRSVRWYGPIFNPSGYASEVINFVVPLKGKLDLGIHHQNNLYSEKFVQGLAADERETLFAQRDRFAGIKGGIAISHNPANGFLRLPDADYQIGRTMFETDRIPKGWTQACNRMDEIWVPSQFNVETFAACGVERDKLVIMPGSADEHFFDPKKHQPLALKNRAAYNFLSIFEWSSRKGWDVLLATYLREFSAEDDVCFHLRTYLFSKPDEDPRTAIERRIREFAATLNLGNKPLPRIEIIADQVPSAQLPAFYLAADCLLAPSRGEGWGRPQHEAMLMERPVIATNWSANTEFMADEFSYLIDYEMVEAKLLEPELWHYRGHRWANPNETHLRKLLRHVQQNPEEGRTKGRLARQHMVKHYGREVVANKVLRRLNAIESKLSAPYLPAVTARTLAEAKETKFPQREPVVSWEGTYLDYGSLSHVNREFTAKLVEQKSLRLHRVSRQAKPTVIAPEFQRLAKQIAPQAPRNVEITLRHAWPPDFSAPASGALVVMQPWEFGALPAEWTKAMERVDEVWVNSQYVRRVYLDSGVEPSKVKYLPLGINPDRFRPDVKPLPLNTQKKFKFLFVGGTIHRKGPDLLLQAYLSKFTAADDVCLVIKDFGGQSVYAGQTLAEQIRTAQATPNAPEILYLDQEMPAEDLPRLYVACDCLVHPYRGEGFGLPVLEAMACALPVIVTGGGSTDDFASAEVTYRIPAVRAALGNEVSGMKLVQGGWWLEPIFTDLQKTMREVFENPAEAKARGVKASEIARRDWTWAQSVKAAELLLLDLAGRREAAQQAELAKRFAKAPAIHLPRAALLGDLRGAREAMDKRVLPLAWERTVKALNERPFHPEAWLLLADVAQAMGDITMAIHCAHEAKKLTPRWKEVQRKLGSLDERKQAGYFTWPALPVKPTEPRVSVCLITRNEERFLKQCLESVKDLAWQIVVMDTGSTDKTVEIAKSFGAEVYHTTWQNDFSAARNAAMEYVRGDWVLSLDADEELLPEAKATLRKEIQSGDAIAYRLPIIDIGREDEGCSYIPRLFRNAHGLFYVSRVHEQIFSSVEVRRRQWSMENKLSTAAIRHHGYQEQIVRNREKSARNLKLLELALEEWPNEPNLLMSMGLELARIGQIEDGLSFYLEAFQVLSHKPADEVAPELRETLLSQFTTQLMATRQFGEIVQVLNSPLALSQTGLVASHHFTMGLAFMELKQPAQAIEQFRKCLAKREQRSLAPVNKEIHKAGPHHCLANCLAQLGKKDEARASYEQARKLAPESVAVLFDYAKFEQSLGHPVEALQLLHALISLEPRQEAFWGLGGQIALSRADFYEFAADWSAEAVKHHPNSLLLARQHAEALTLNRNLTEALTWWKQSQGAAQPAGRAAIVICELAGGMPLTPLETRHQELVSREFIQWYRRLVEAQALDTVEKINRRLEHLETVLPSAAQALTAVLQVAEVTSA